MSLYILNSFFVGLINQELLVNLLNQYVSADFKQTIQIPVKSYRYILYACIMPTKRVLVIT